MQVWLIGRVDQMALLAAHLARQDRLVRWDSFFRAPTGSSVARLMPNRRVAAILKGHAGNHWLPDLLGYLPRKTLPIGGNLVTDTLLGRLAARNVPDVALLHGQGNYTWPALQKARAKGIKIISDVTGQMAETRRIQLAAAGIEYRPMSRMLARQRWREACLADAVTVPSETVANELARLGLPEKRIYLVPYDTPLAGDLLARQRRPTQAGGLFVGEIRQEKGLAVLEAARASMSLHFPLLLCGKRHRNATHLFPTERPRHLGRDALIEAYLSREIFVFPSYSEGSSRAVMEAMAAGCAVVTTPAAGGPIRDGQNGLLVPPGDATALRHALERLVATPDLRRRLGAAARQRIADLTAESYGRRVERVYEEVLG